MKNRGRGPLVVIGGAEDKRGDKLILHEFVRLAGGDRTTIAIMTVATSKPDRADRLMELAGRAAARAFDRVFIREDRDRRRRDTGVLAERICRAITSEVAELDCRIISDECLALETAIRELGQNDLLVHFFDNYDGVMQTLRSMGAVAVRPESLVTTERRRHERLPPRGRHRAHREPALAVSGNLT